MAKQECKAEDCSRPEKIHGWCGWCVKKFERGVYDVNGKYTYEASQKRLAKKRKAENREKKKKLVEWKKRKEGIKSRLNPTRLRVLQDEHPETRATIHCPVFKICMSEASCYGRIYLHSRHKECAKCHVHDDRLDFLEEFLTKQESKDEQE